MDQQTIAEAEKYNTLSKAREKDGGTNRQSIVKTCKGLIKKQNTGTNDDKPACMCLNSQDIPSHPPSESILDTGIYKFVNMPCSCLRQAIQTTTKTTHLAEHLTE